MMTIGFLCALIATTQSSQPTDLLAQERVAGPVGLALDRQLTRFAEYGFSGSVLVVRDGQVVLLKGYGLADVERGIPNTPATRFEMNSMTKMIALANPLGNKDLVAGGARWHIGACGRKIDLPLRDL